MPINNVANSGFKARFGEPPGRPGTRQNRVPGARRRDKPAGSRSFENRFSRTMGMAING
jgi:hypothetical protein